MTGTCPPPVPAPVLIPVSMRLGIMFFHCEWNGQTVHYLVVVYVIGDQGDAVSIHCVPVGQMDITNVQLYEWRTVDNKVIVSKPGKIHVDVNTGLLQIRNVKFTDSAQVFCSAVLPSEERVTFTHNLIGSLYNTIHVAA